MSGANARTLYLDLLKQALTDSLYDPVDPAVCEVGRDWPSRACTMIGRKRLDNLQFCAEDELTRSIPGDLIETGVWLGGAAILMRAILKVDGVGDRLGWAADSFEGLPPPATSRYSAGSGHTHHTFTELVVSIDDVKAKFAKFSVLDEGVVFLKGLVSRHAAPSAYRGACGPPARRRHVRQHHGSARGTVPTAIRRRVCHHRRLWRGARMPEGRRGLPDLAGDHRQGRADRLDRRLLAPYRRRWWSAEPARS